MKSQLTIRSVLAKANILLHQKLSYRQRMERSLKSHVFQQAAVTKIGHIALQGKSLKSFLKRVIGIVADTLQIENVALYTVSPRGKKLLLQASLGWTKNAVKTEVSIPNKQMTIPYLLQKEDPISIVRSVREKQFTLSQLMMSYGTVSSASVLIGNKEKKFGMLTLQTNGKRKFSREDIHFLQSVANTITTVIERKNIEEKLFEKTALLQTVIEGLTDAIYVKDLQGRYVLINSAGARYLGKRKKEILRKTINKLISSQEAAAIIIQDKKVLTSGRAVTYEEQVSTLGKKKTFLATKGIYKNAEGKKIGIFGISRNITQRKELENSLRTSRDHIEVILQGIADGILMHDKFGNIRYANATVAQIFGHTSVEAMATKNINALIQDLQLKDEYNNPFPLAQLPGYQVLHGAKTAEALTQFIPATSGETKWMLVKARATVALQENDVCALMIFHDITERVKLEKRKDDFISIASHELKTPLTSMKAFTQILQSCFAQQEDEKATYYLSRVDTQLTKLTNIINSLLDVSKMQAGKLDLTEGEFDFDAMVEEVVSDIRNTSKKHTIFVEGKTFMQIAADKDRIYQVFINLLSNAIKYSPENNKIIVKIAAKAETICVSVQDFGVGISPENHTRVFNRFFKTNKQKSETYPGLGIGLYTSSVIIQRHNGKIWVESSGKEGSIFHFTLPVRQQFETKVSH